MNAGTPPPSPEEQLSFLAKLQRLFAEGDFTATYKFALLVALADLAVEFGADDGNELELSNRKIAERFVILYWRHVSPYGTSRQGSEPGILSQNNGAQAAVLTAIHAFRSKSVATSAEQARSEAGYAGLLTKVASVVSAQPLSYMQNFGGGCDPFLFERSRRGAIRLKPGIAFCLRRFYPLVRQMCTTHWVKHIKSNQRNHAVLGDAGDLEDFLFATSRQSLAIVAVALRKLDGPRCFYCGAGLNEADVDHFVPFSLYPRDQVQNFVLAHPGCNRSKSDSLAARSHLERWMERLTLKDDQLAEIGGAAGVASDQRTAHRVAEWGYTNVHAAGGKAWRTAAQYEVVDGGYLDVLRGAPL